VGENNKFQGTKEANPKQIRDIIAMQIGLPAQRTSASSTPMPQQQGGQQQLVNGLHGTAPIGHHVPPQGGPMQRPQYHMPGGMPPHGQMPPMPGQIPHPQAPIIPAAAGPVATATAQNVHNKFLQVKHEKIKYFIKK